MRIALCALAPTADEARFRAVAPFFISSPDRTREAIARVFHGGHVPARLEAVICNEIDALMVVFAIELRMWSRSLKVSCEEIVTRWLNVLPKGGVGLASSDAFWAGLLFLVAPRGDPEDVDVTLPYVADRFSMTARPQLLVMAELVEVAECLSLFTDEPRVDERDDEAGNLRRALRRGVQISRGEAERCIVRIPLLTRRQYDDALAGLFKRDFLPLSRIKLERGAAAGNRWWQLLVDRLQIDTDAARPLTLVDRLKRAARDQFADFVAVNELSQGPLAALSADIGLAMFLNGSKPGLIILGAGGTGKSSLLRRLAEPGAEVKRTVLIYPLRNRRAVRRLTDLIGASIGAPVSTEIDLIDIAEAFARRDEELLVVLDGLNEMSDADQLVELLGSVVEGAARLCGPAAPRAGLRLILTSRPETYFRACSRMRGSPHFEAFASFSSCHERDPRPYLEIQPLTPAEREALFGLYFVDAREDGAEHEMTRAARRDRRFADLLSKPIMIALAGDLHRRGVPIRTLRSSPDLIDLVVEDGFRRLRTPAAAEWGWRVLERIFERRLLMGDGDVVKFEDLWMTAPGERDAIVAALMDLADMGLIQRYLDQPHRLVEFAHERIEENLLGRYLDRLGQSATTPPAREAANYAVGMCLVLSEGKTLFEEALAYHLAGSIRDHIERGGRAPPPLHLRWGRLRACAEVNGRSRALDRVLAKSLIGCEKRLGTPGERWLARCLPGFVEPAPGPLRGDAERSLVERLVEGLEELMEGRSSGLSPISEELRRAARGVAGAADAEMRCTLLIAQSRLDEERWAEALAEAERAGQSAPAPSTDVVERIRRTKGIALRNIGRIRDASVELQAVVEAQLGRGDLRKAAQTLPSLLEAMREFGDFSSAIGMLTTFELRAGPIASGRDRLLLAMWRGILNKNLMQDAVLFRWQAGSGSFVSAQSEVDHFRQEAEDALARALDIAALSGSDDEALPDLVQVQSELAETALSYALLNPSALAEADRRLDELSRLLALRFAAEPQIEYHRHCAHRLAIDGDFAPARASLRKASRLARRYGMQFLKADCDLDWGRIVARSPSSFRTRQVQDAREALVRASAYLGSRVGEGTYYPRIAAMLIAALDHALSKRREGAGGPLHLPRGGVAP